MEQNTESMDDKAMPTDSSQTVDYLTTVTNINIKEYELTKKNIISMGNKVRLTDSDEPTGLELYCYVHCSSTDDKLLQQCRGVVVHGDTVIMKAFPYTVELSQCDTENISESLSEDFSKCTFYDSHEGTLIRMFYFGNKWFTCTHRKLNAFRSKWASRESFGSSFKRALEYEVSVNPELKNAIQDGDEGLLEKFQTTLDKEKQYMFLVRNCPENRIVCTAPLNPTVYHVGTFVDGVLSLTDKCYIKYPTQRHFKNLEELTEYVDSIDIRYLQGIICFASDNKQYKIVHKEYQEFFRARGNEPSIKFRYLQVRMNRRTSDILYHLYPDLQSTFEEIENSIYDISKTIYTAYVQRFIKKRFVTVPAEEFAVIRECHKWHEEDRVVNRISVDKVINIFNQQTPTNINRMIRRFRTEKDTKVVQQKVTEERTKSGTVPSTPVSSPPPPPPTPTKEYRVVSPLTLPERTLFTVPVA